MKRPPGDAFLCEHCGYELTGVARSSACSECGRPAERSHPDHRAGSPWQRGAGLRSWAGTLAMLARHPVGAWDELRVERRSSWTLLATNLAIGSAVCGALVLAAPTASFMALIFLTLTYSLSLLEMVGIRFFGRRRGWRITHEVALTVCAHASYGWLISAVALTVTTWLAIETLLPLSNRWAYPLGLEVRSEIIWIVASYFPGLIVFETLVYFGFVRMRYANPSGVAQPDQVS